jgi:hypothetical protein
LRDLNDLSRETDQRRDVETAKRGMTWEAELLVKYKSLDSREASGVRRITALSWRLLQPKPSHKAYPKARNAAHSKRLREFRCGSAALGGSKNQGA